MKQERPTDTDRASGIEQLNRRSREILRQIVESYVETGEPVGSRTLSRLATNALSPATIRNVMADLEEAGLLYAPHTSAGRLPTEAGMRLFVNALLEVGNLSEDERGRIEAMCKATGTSPEKVLTQASQSLSGLSRHAGMVVAPKTEARLKHIEFVQLAPGRALVVLVTETGLVENRVIDLPLGVPASALIEATNFLSARLIGRTLGEARAAIFRDLEDHKAQVGTLTQQLVEAGLAVWAGDGPQDDKGLLIIKGQSKLLEDVTAISDLERVRRLFEALETKETLLQLLDLAQEADGLQIFIGAESGLFRHTGCSMVISPYKDAQQRVIGAIGVIGPTRMNYARIIPMVDYTAQVMSRLLG